MPKHHNKNRKSGKSGFAPTNQDNRIIRAILHTEGTLSSTAGGVIANSFGMDPSGCPDWADFSSTYDEFRVLGTRLKLVSAQTNSTAINNANAAIAFDNDNSSAPTGLNQLTQYRNARVLSIIMDHVGGRPFLYTCWRPTSGVPIAWVDIANPSGSLGATRLYSSGLTASTAYLYWSIEYLVEFRGRR